MGGLSVMSRIDTSTDMGSEKQIETAPIISLSPWFLHMSVKMHYSGFPGEDGAQDPNFLKVPSNRDWHSLRSVALFSRDCYHKVSNISCPAPFSGASDCLRVECRICSTSFRENRSESFPSTGFMIVDQVFVVIRHPMT
jgi:hypothetical protein